MIGVSVTAHAAADRASVAKDRTEAKLIEDCRKLGVSYPPNRILLRGFKREAVLEVWVKGKDPKYVRLETLAIAKQSGVPGPKRKDGDLQVPEGVYVVDRFNPNSRFHLSLGLNYPNASDRVRSDRPKPGGDIFIHGSNVSIGCLAMTDPVIERLYTLCRSSKTRVQVHLFPCRMAGAGYRSLLAKHPEHAEFWSELEPVYQAFEVTRQEVKVTISRNGVYSVMQK